MEITIDKTSLQAALIAAAKNDVRRQLNGVYIDFGGYVVGTDGHCLFAAKFDSEQKEDGEIILDRAMLELALKGIPKTRKFVSLTIDDGSATLDVFPVGTIKEVFPDWRHVVPKEYGYPPGYIVSDISTRMKKIQRLYKRQESDSLVFASEGTAMVIGPDWRFVAMPIRCTVLPKPPAEDDFL